MIKLKVLMIFFLHFMDISNVLTEFFFLGGFHTCDFWLETFEHTN
jgi:hypothetical protein